MRVSDVVLLSVAGAALVLGLGLGLGLGLSAQAWAGPTAVPEPSGSRVGTKGAANSSARVVPRSSSARLTPVSRANRRAPVSRVSRYAPVELYHINRRDTLRLRLYDQQGRAVSGVQKRVERFLRCHHTNKLHRIDSRLVRLIYETGRGFPGRRLEVVSGYRHPSAAKNPKSPHMQGQACDLRVAGIKNSDLRDFFRRRFTRVGVGYYPNSAFVHLDVRKSKSAFWIDYSGPGQAAVYAENPFEDLKTGRADTPRPPQAAPEPAPVPAADQHDEQAEVGAVNEASPTLVPSIPAPPGPRPTPSTAAVPGQAGARFASP